MAVDVNPPSRGAEEAEDDALARVSAANRCARLAFASSVIAPALLLLILLPLLLSPLLLPLSFCRFADGDADDDQSPRLRLSVVLLSFPFALALLGVDDVTCGHGYLSQSVVQMLLFSHALSIVFLSSSSIRSFSWSVLYS